MISSTINALPSNPFNDEDITTTWMRCHEHLQPYSGALSNSSNIEHTLFANVRLGGNQWFEMAEITYKSRRFYWKNESRNALLSAYPDLLDMKVDAVDARLWSAQPTLINIEPTTRCNFNCWYCVGRHMKQDDIRLENFGAMLDNFSGLKTIALVGEGEPLMHKDFFAMARLAMERNIRVMIISNGSAFSKSVIKQLCETKVAYVAISIDSTDPATFASSRLDGNLEKIWEGIRRLREYRDANGYIYPKISLKGTLFHHTQNQLPEIVDLALENGVEIFESFQPLNPMKNYVRIYPKQHLNELETIDEVVGSIGRDSSYATEKLKSFRSFCNDEKIDFFPEVRKNPIIKNCDETWIYSLLSGDVTPCCQIKSSPSKEWNIFKRSIEEILADAEYENLRFNLWNGIFPDYCSGCWKTR